MAHILNPDENVLVSIDPATLEPLGREPLATAEDVRMAVARADAAFPAWAALTVAQRAAFLLRARDDMLARLDEVCALISAENGKPRTEALTAEVHVVAELITLYAKRAPSLLADRPIPLANPLLARMKSSRIAYEPLGVVSVVSPWNYPFAIPMSGIAMALLAGNTVVFKPASDAALVGRMIDRILNVGGGLPAGVLNTVIATGASMGETLFSPPIRKVVFTGSTAVGRRIQEIAARHFIPTVMELGGKDAMIVCRDADLDLAAQGAVWGAFTNCGQVCASVERVYVDREVHDAFVEKVVAVASRLRVGRDSGEHDIDLGPLANASQRDLVARHVADAVAKGARIRVGGHPPEGLSGYFFMPTVLTECDHSMQAVVEETFGPLLPILSYSTEDEAVRQANDSIYGLGASVWTRDRERGLALARRLQAGSVLVNDVTYSYGLVDTPWQGMKESGMGRSHSDEGLLEFVYPKHINIDRSPAFMRRRMWWFPYSTTGYELLKKVVRAFVEPLRLPRLLATVLASKAARKILY